MGMRSIKEYKKYTQVCSTKESKIGKKVKNMQAKKLKMFV